MTNNNDNNHEMVNIYQNPYYHCVIAASPIIVPSKSPRIKYDSGGKILDGEMSKSYMKFEDFVKNVFKKKNKSSWPYADYLQLVLEIKLTASDFDTKDIDNMAKTILDSFKGIIYKDDSQIVSLSVLKIDSDFPGFILGIRRTEKDAILKMYPDILSFSEPTGWKNIEATGSNINDSCICWVH